MNFITADSYEILSKKAAAMLCGQVALKPNSVLGLATGSTPLGTYSEMAEKCSDRILYDKNRFIRFCQDHKIEISEEELENLRKCIIDFR